MKPKVAVIILLSIFFLLAYGSSLGDSNIIDEVAHTPAGYSYIVKQDMRLNPEHPPLLKDAAGLSVWAWSKLSGTTINFDETHDAWSQDINGQWDWGFDWMFRQGNDADAIVFWARLPMLLLGVLLGWYIYRFGRDFFTVKVGLLALFIYAFSPTFLAHTHLVTTDVGATFGFFVALYYFLRWYRLARFEPVVKSISETNGEAQRQTPPKGAGKELLKAGIAFGIAQLLKFSAFLLIPTLLLLVFILVLAHSATVIGSRRARLNFFLKHLWELGLGTIAIFVIGYLVVWPVYAFHVWNYPSWRQLRDTVAILGSYGGVPTPDGIAVCSPLNDAFMPRRCPAEITIWGTQRSFMRPYSQYLLGLLMVIQRAAGGNTVYFFGEVSASGLRSYFPVVYLLKEALALHVMTLLALVIAVRQVIRRRRPVEAILNNADAGPLRRICSWIHHHPAETALFLFIVVYWVQSIRSTLNIGVRHVLPTFPAIYLLVSRQIVDWLRLSYTQTVALNFLASVWQFIKRSARLTAKYSIVAILLLWMMVSALVAYPYYLPYFNELVGTDNGYRYVVDSNYDWGQDLHRLVKFVEERNIERIKIYYFGGSAVEYYLGNRYEFLYPDRGVQKGWIAVSATMRQNGNAAPAHGFDKSTDHFKWLNSYTPVARAGKSIFIYYIP